MEKLEWKVNDMLKFAEGGLLDRPIEITGDAEPLVAAENINYERLGDFMKALSLDALLLELEQEGDIHICLKQ